MNFLYFLIILGTSLGLLAPSTYSSTTSLSSQNGFGANNKGLTTPEISFKNSLQSFKSEFQNRKPEQPDLHLVHSSRLALLMTSYQNILSDLFHKNLIPEETLESVHKNKDYFLVSFFSINTEWKLNIYREALVTLKKNLLQENLLNDFFKLKADEFLKAHIQELKNKTQTKKSADKNTREVFHPHSMVEPHKTFSNFNPPIVTQLENGQEISIVSTLDGKIYFINNETGKLLYNPFNAGAWISHPPILTQLKNGKKIIVVHSENLYIYILDINTGALLFDPISIEYDSIQYSSFFNLQNGQEAVLLFGSKGINMIDLNTGATVLEKEIKNSNKIHSPSIQINTLQNGKSILTFITTDHFLHAIDLESGQFIIENKKIDTSLNEIDNHHNIFNSFSTFAKFINEKEVIIFTIGNEVFFLNLNEKTVSKVIEGLEDKIKSAPIYFRSENNEYILLQTYQDLFFIYNINTEKFELESTNNANKRFLKYIELKSGKRLIIYHEKNAIIPKNSKDNTPTGALHAINIDTLTEEHPPILHYLPILRNMREIKLKNGTEVLLFHTNQSEELSLIDLNNWKQLHKINIFNFNNVVSNFAYLEMNNQQEILIFITSDLFIYFVDLHSGDILFQNKISHMPDLNNTKIFLPEPSFNKNHLFIYSIMALHFYDLFKSTPLEETPTP